MSLGEEGLLKGQGKESLGVSISTSEGLVNKMSSDESGVDISPFPLK